MTITYIILNQTQAIVLKQEKTERRHQDHVCCSAGDEDAATGRALQGQLRNGLMGTRLGTHFITLLVGNVVYMVVRKPALVA